MRITHIENRIEQQLTLSKLIAQALESFHRIAAEDITQRLVNSRISALKENWEKFSIHHDAILIAIRCLNPEEIESIRENSYLINDVYTLTYDRYLDTLDKMNSYIESEDPPLIRTSSTISVSSSTFHQNSKDHHTRLPRIDLPKFNGIASEWMSFKDLFSAIIIRNSTLSPVEKLQYLKSSLTGTAAHLLKNTALISDNFEKSWTDLVSYYENKRLLVNSAIHSLLSLKKITKESSTDLERLYTNIMQIYRTLETLQRPVDKCDDFLVFISVQKLDSESVKLWEQHLGSAKELPTWKQFCEFLVTRLLSLQAFEKSQNIPVTKKTTPLAIKVHHQSQKKNNTNQLVPSCVVCSAKHWLNGCPQYTSLTSQQRHALITKHGLCFNCLGKHRVSECRSLKRCTKCGKKHHTTIHKRISPNQENSNKQVNSSESKETPAKPSQAQVLHATLETIHQSINCVLLATAQVFIFNKEGSNIKIRALIDPGSEVTILSEKVVQTLRLPRTQSSIPVLGVGEDTQSPIRTRGMTSFKITLRYDQSEEFQFSAHILTKLTSLLPSTQISGKLWPHFKDLPLADPQFGSPSSVDLIIGADFYHLIIKEGLRKGPPNTPIAQLTSFGWIISGPTTNDISLNPAQSYHITTDSQLYDLLQRFWQLDNVPINHELVISPEDQQCEQHFKDTHTPPSGALYCTPAIQEFSSTFRKFL